jgi:hypothetical protein
LNAANHLKTDNLEIGEASQQPYISEILPTVLNAALPDDKTEDNISCSASENSTWGVIHDVTTEKNILRLMVSDDDANKTRDVPSNTVNEAAAPALPAVSVTSGDKITDKIPLRLLYSDDEANETLDVPSHTVNGAAAPALPAVSVTSGDKINAVPVTMRGIYDHDPEITDCIHATPSRMPEETEKSFLVGYSNLDSENTETVPKIITSTFLVEAAMDSDMTTASEVGKIVESMTPAKAVCESTLKTEVIVESTSESAKEGINFSEAEATPGSAAAAEIASESEAKVAHVEKMQLPRSGEEEQEPAQPTDFEDAMDKATEVAAEVSCVFVHLIPLENV